MANLTTTTGKQPRKKDLSEEIEATQSSRERLLVKSPKDLLKRLTKDEPHFGEEVVSLWRRGNSDRQAWLERQERFLDSYDEFLNPVVQAPAEWSSDMHLPIALTTLKTFHARFFAAVFSQDPFFKVTARQAANEERAVLMSDLMQYTFTAWANDYQGIENEIDTLIWQWAGRGVGLLKFGWDRKFTQYVDVVRKTFNNTVTVVQPGGTTVSVPTQDFRDVDELVTVETCNAPYVKVIAPEDLVIIGGGGDVDAADAVIESTYPTASDLWTLVDQGIFDEDAVKAVIEAGDDPKSGEGSNFMKELQSEKAGLGSLDKDYDLDRYHVLEAHLKKDVYGTGINTDIVVWVHVNSGKILRATFLHRINSKTKKRPYAKADFYKREGQPYGVGLIELTYSICTEIDALNNMAVDFGVLSSLPFGYYRATSSISQTSIPIEPGQLVPVEDPNDVFFPQLGNRAAFSMQQLQFLYGVLERLTGISDLTLGVLGAQGAARTATGARAVMQESNANLDIFLRRLNRAIKKMLHYTAAQLQEKLPPGLEFRITGQHGDNYFRQIKTPNEIAGSYDFSLEPNSATSNPAIRLENAQQAYQLTQNPIDLQLGLVTPLQRYEAIKNLLLAMGIKDFGKFVQKPQQTRVLSPEDIANRVLAGIDVPLDPTQDLGGFVAYWESIKSEDELLGQFSVEQTMALERKAREAAALMQAMEQMQAQQANVSQMQANAANGAQQAGMVTPSPAQAGGAEAAMQQ